MKIGATLGCSGGYHPRLQGGQALGFIWRFQWPAGLPPVRTGSIVNERHNQQPTNRDGYCRVPRQ
jgi:hypothetical protein